MCIDACVYFTLCSGYTLHYFETDNLFDKTVGPLNAGESLCIAQPAQSVATHCF